MKSLNTIKNYTLWIFILIFIFSGLGVFAQKGKVDQNSETKEEFKLNLIVTDKENNFVNNLSKDDFSVIVDGKEVAEFTLEKETLPLLYMVSGDNSGSMRFLWDDVKKSVKTIIEQNQAEDLTALMRFVSKDKIQTTDKFSADKDYLNKNLDLFQIEGGKTALIDAIYKSIEIVSEQKGVEDNYRRVVVIFSDGEDRESEKSPKQLLELLKARKIQIFFIGLVNELDQDGGFINRSPMKKAKEFVETVAKESGGVALFPKRIEDLLKIANQMSAQMHTQFVINIPNIENLEGKNIVIKPTKNSAKRKLKFNY